MRISSPVAKRRARIEIVPLIDIIFFLLATFVMVSLSMIKNEGVPVKLPVATTSAPEERKASATISITESGDIYLNKTLSSIEDVKLELNRMKTENPDVKVFINGDEHAYFGRAVEILDEVRGLGIQKVSIQTQRKQ